MANLPERLMIRNGTYYCRVWVPRDVAGTFGRQLVVTSLRTKDLKTAKTRLARKSIELEDKFNLIRADQATGTDSALKLDSEALRARFAETAREHAIEISDREFARRAEFFRQATEAPAQLWSGELGPLPSPADFGHGEADAYTYFDHLAAEGDLERVIAYLVRFRLIKRIEDLRRARLTGNLAEFIATAEARIPGLSRAQAITLGRLLLEEELKALQALAEGQPAPCLGDLRSGASHFQSGQQEFPPSGLCAGR